MKSRITLTVDPKVSHRAKDVARREGISLSALVERLLSEASGEGPVKSGKPFSERWKGKMRLSSATDGRSTRLKKKYKLP
jgi:hypothetical protein